MIQLNISKVQEQLKFVVQQVSSSGEPVAITDRNKRIAIIAPYDIYKGLLAERPEYNVFMAEMFARRLLFNAPKHMIESQIMEFEKLAPSELCAFVEIKSLPIPKKKREAIIKVVGCEVVERLERRSEIAKAISKAKKEGVYEAEEHKTGMLDLS